MHAALLNIPNYASAMVTTSEVIDSISSLKILGISAPFHRARSSDCTDEPRDCVQPQ
jgi:hypothetical protein